MKNKISKKDKKDWEEFVTSNDKVPNKDIDIKNQNRNSISVRSIDLHGYTLDEANKILEEFISKAHQDNINKLKVVTGKGMHSQNEKNPYVSKDLGILKYSVPEFIKNSRNLSKIIFKTEGANIKDGGTGAFYIYLKKNK